MKWIKNEPSQRIPIFSWCENIEDSAMRQAINLATHPAIQHHVALMPDCHTGMGMPIGGVIAAEDALIPNAVGVDIGCGMVAVQTDLSAEHFTEMPLRRALLNRLKECIPVGEGVSHDTEQEWEGFEKRVATHPFGENGREWPSKLDRKNLGTLGGGNHFAELQKSDDGFIWLMLHSGSRNLGHRIATHYHTIAKKLNTQFRVALPDPELAFLPSDTEHGRNYFTDMKFALAYALENRRRMMEVFKRVLLEFAPDARFLQEVNIHHNYAAIEEHFGRKFFIHRKGATSAKRDEVGIIPGSMGTASYIVRGLGNPASFMSCSHGAGRLMSRTAACQSFTAEQCDEALAGVAYDRWKPFKKIGRKGKGLLDLSEAPQAYKPIDDVIDAERDLIEPLVRLTPLAVLKG